MKFLNNTVIKVLISLDNKNNNVLAFSKKHHMIWSQVRDTINTLYIYNLVEVQKYNGKITFNLTKDGTEVQDYLLKINTIVSRNCKDSLSEVYGYKDPKEFKDEVQKDIL